MTLNTCKVQVLLFADSTVLIADNEEDLKHNITVLHEAVREHKLQINWGKTNTMVISKEPMECNIEVEEHSVKSMKEVVYLGVKFRRVGIATSAVGAMQRNVFGSREWSKKATEEVYNAMVVPMMT